jgi:NAD-dependent SIR2 family protein deacetylase
MDEKNSDFTDAVHRAAEMISAADGVIVAAGAGMGVDSGLPDFRGVEGFWRAYPSLAGKGVRFEDIADPAAFESSPRSAWGFYGHRLKLYRETMPHRGYKILKKWDASCPNGLFAVTSNVDGHFQRAGFSNRDVYEIHGSIHHLQCSKLCSNAIWPAEHVEPDVDEDTLQMVSLMPECPNCGALARPNILMFNDFGWVSRRTVVQRLEFEDWLSGVARIAVLEIGAGTAIPSIRELGRQVVSRMRGTLVRINPREYEVERGEDVSIQSGSLRALEAIDNLMLGRA